MVSPISNFGSGGLTNQQLEQNLEGTSQAKNADSAKMAEKDKEVSLNNKWTALIQKQQ
ncbi:hypothetical protein LRS56_22670 [Pseudomonas poae]|nr:hypothetical protein LRS56_22670 [Pseudomonas poae]